MQILTAEKTTLNLARRQTISIDAIIAEHALKIESRQRHTVSAFSRLNELKEMLPNDRLALGTLPYIRAVCDALKNCGELAEVEEIVAIHRNYLSFYRWLEDLWIEGGPDARKEYWRVLAITQRKVKGHDVQNLELLWRRILLMAGTQYPIHYSEVALQGLCWSERSATAEAFASVIQTFVNWAYSIGLEEEYFKTLLRGFIEHLEDALGDKASRERWAAFDIAASEFRNSVDKYVRWLGEVLSEGGRTLSKERRSVPSWTPNKRALDTLIRWLGTAPAAAGIARVREFYEAYAEYTWRYGDFDLLAKSLTRMAFALLEHPTYASSTDVASLVRDMAIELIRWQPNYRSGWMLWLRALNQNEGHSSVEVILWETIRRFPDDKFFRNQLADIHVKQGRYCEAEHLLRLNIEDFPTDAASYRKLADLLARQPERLEEAILIGNQASRIRGFKTKGLTSVLRKIASSAVGKDILFISRISSQDLSLPLTGDPSDEMANSIVLHARAMLAQFQLTCPGLEAEESSARELISLVHDNDLPFAKFILARTLPNYDDSNDLSTAVFPMAFAKAIATLEPANWQALSMAARSPESRWLVRVAESLLSSGPQDNDFFAWLKGKTRVAGRISTLLRRRLLELTGDVDSEEGVVIELSKRRKEVVKILGDTVAAMFDEEIAA
jgi:tetratricopeptide (TPR) repeat protein